MPSIELQSITPEELQKLYYDPEIGLSSPAQFHKELRSRGYQITLKQVKEFLEGQEISAVFARPLRQRSGMPFVPVRPFDEWQCDITYTDKPEKSKYKGRLRNKYLLVAIDHLTKYAWVFPSNKKDGPTMIKAFEYFTNHPPPGHEKPAVPHKIYTDQGSEYNNNVFKQYCDSNGIRVKIAEFANDHAGSCERFHQTLKRIMQKYMSISKQDPTLESNLKRLVSNYNHRYQSTIKMSPIEAYENSIEARRNMYEQRMRHYYKSIKHSAKQELHVGDSVRVMEKTEASKRLGEKGYLKKWSTKIYTIEKLSGRKVYLKETDEIYPRERVRLET